VEGRSTGSTSEREVGRFGTSTEESIVKKERMEENVGATGSLMLVVEVFEKRTEVVGKGLVSGRSSVTGTSMLVGSVNTGSREVTIGALEDFVRSWAMPVTRVRAEVVSVVDVAAPSTHSSTKAMHVSQ